MSRTPISVLLAVLYTIAIPVLGYLSIGAAPGIIFLVGFGAGLVMFLNVPTRPSWDRIKVPYYLTLGLFVIHRIDEQLFGFFDALTEVTGVAYPSITYPPGFMLGLLSFAWLLSPLLIKKGYSFGYYGAWSVFCAMGLSELAHFIFPFMTPEPYGFFPGMLTVIPLAPAAWWGMSRLMRSDEIEKTA